MNQDPSQPSQPSQMLPPLKLPVALDQDARVAMAAWVNVYWTAVYDLLYRMAGQQHEAEDLTQETFLRAAQRRDSFTAGTNARAWLMRIATNAFLDSRRRKKVARTQPMMDEANLPAANVGLAGDLNNQELGAALATALQQLPEAPRAVFLLRTREELSFKEIAQAVGGTEENARWQMLQARRKLMESLKGWI